MVVVGGLPVYHYRAADAVAEGYGMVMLVEAGLAQQKEVARAFGRSERTVCRHQERHAEAETAGSDLPSIGLRTTLLTLFLTPLLRIQRPERIKQHDPAGFGRLLRLDRAPEVKTDFEAQAHSSGCPALRGGARGEVPD